MQEPLAKNKLLQIASILMIAAAVLAILITAVNVFTVATSVNDLSAEEIVALEVQLQDTDFTMEQAGMILQGTALVAFGMAALFNLVKIVVGVLGLRKTASGSTFYLVWGIVLLVFGVLSIPTTANLLGLCNAVGGLAAPLLFIAGGSQNKKRLKG